MLSPALAERLIRMGNPKRSDRAALVPETSRWLRHHEDGGWLQSDDDLRAATARRLLFVKWLVRLGVVSDAFPPATDAVAAVRAEHWRGLAEPQPMEAE